MAVARGLLIAGACVIAVSSASGASRAVIVVPQGARKPQMEAARILQSYIRRSSRTELPIQTAPGEAFSLHVGRSAFVDGLKLRFEELGPDGFVLKRVDDRNYVIAGLTDDGTEFGVYDFLERYVGVRWLFPTDLGTDVPERAQLAAGNEEIRSVPVFFSRQLSGLNAESRDWARRNRMRQGIAFHHNMTTLLPPSRYARSRPDFYPKIGGKRLIPPNDKDFNWQPNFSAPGIVEAAADAIRDHFRRHPDEDSFSLGVNDGWRFDESPESLARENPAPNYLGRRNVSDSYYRWCNEVVEKVLQTYPDKYFGCLAYSYVADPPRFKLHPNIIPFLTYERLRWSDPRLRRIGEDLTRRWKEAATHLGFYDYAYGQDYCLPRVWPHLMADYLRYGRQTGVRAHYAEFYPNWGEGPKAYVYLKLQWDPGRDVDALLGEWYERCVGPAAAPMLREYYDIWERYWTRAVHETPWWSLEGQYLDDGTPTYMNALQPADLAKCQALLDQAVQKAGTDLQKKRAEYLRTSFEFYRTSARAYEARTLAGIMRVSTDAEATRAVQRATDAARENAARQDYIRKYLKDPLLSVGDSSLKRAALRGDTWHADLMWRGLDWARPGTSTADLLAKVSSSQPSPLRDNASAILAIAAGECRQVVANDSFEQTIEPWGKRVEGPGQVELKSSVARSGRRSVECSGTKLGGIGGFVPVEAGTYVAVARMYKPAAQAGGRAVMCVQLRGEGGKPFGAPNVEVLLPAGEWATIAYPLEVPRARDNVAINAVYLMVYAADLQPDQKAYIDDVQLFRLPDGMHPRSLPD